MDDGYGEVRHQAAIAGRITDGPQDASPIAGAQVTITSKDAAFAERLALKALAHGRGWDSLAVRLDRTVSGDDGRFCFRDLPAGTYTVTAEWVRQGSRYGTATASATVARDADGIKLATLDLVLPPTALKGKVSANGAPVAMAEVRIKGGGEATFTDAKGAYLLSAIEPGERTIQVQANGFAAKESRVTVQQRGQFVDLDFSLARAGAGNGHGAEKNTRG